MERRVSDTEKRGSQIKLPAIQHRKGESSRVLSNTMPDNCRIRPSSMHKVEDLEKKLFEKLESYQHPSRKAIKRGTKKKIEGENTSEQQIQGYERIQKLMPNLYTKLIESKKPSISDSVPQPESEVFSTQPKFNKPNTAQQPKRKSQLKQVSQQIAQEEDLIQMSKQQYDQVYRDYSRRQQLQPETSQQELASMGQSLLVCEKQIAELTKSMENMIRQLGNQCLIDFEEDEG